jgi:hypothetical protein
MKAKEYIANGLVTDYCLGIMTDSEKAAFEQELNTSPELRAELNAIQEGLNKYLSAYSLTPPQGTKDKVLGTLENILREKQMDLRKLPIINQYTNPKSWLDAVKPLLPAEIPAGHFMHVLTETETTLQVLVMTATDVEDEIHDNVYESFIILEGECECRIGTEVIRVKAGGYVQIPLHQHHDLKIISDYVIGIMQRIAA